MSAYRVVEDFERALSEYTGAPFVVTTNSCSMSLFLALRRFEVQTIYLPERTYCSAPMAAVHAGHSPVFENVNWRGEYQLRPFPIWDCARRFTKGMYRAGRIQCVSFQTSKILGLEQGGAILHDDPKADEWYRRARFDGRLDASEKLPQMLGWHCYLNPSTAALGLARLASLPKFNNDQAGAADFPDLSKLTLWPSV